MARGRALPQVVERGAAHVEVERVDGQPQRLAPHGVDHVERLADSAERRPREPDGHERHAHVIALARPAEPVERVPALAERVALVGAVGPLARLDQHPVGAEPPRERRRAVHLGDHLLDARGVAERRVGDGPERHRRETPPREGLGQRRPARGARGPARAWAASSSTASKPAAAAAARSSSSGSAGRRRRSRPVSRAALPARVSSGHSRLQKCTVAPPTSDRSARDITT